jgi:AmiR/NasT family two-component response regulator
LRPSHARLSLEQVLTELEEEMEERRLVAEAKRCLQTKRGITEEQAHAELRTVSRKSRKKLKDVALQIIDLQQIHEGKTA